MFSPKSSPVAAAVVLLLGGCSISPQPAPPGTTPEPGVHADAIRVSQKDSSTVEITGDKGAATVSATLSVANLDAASSDTSTTTDADGRFVVTLPGQLTDVFRFVATADGQSLDADLTGTTSGEQSAVVEPAFGDCLEQSPAGALDFGTVALGSGIQQATVDLTNRCAAPITLVSVDLRDQVVFISTGPGPMQLPITLAQDEAATLEVGFKGLNAGSYTDYVRARFTDANGPRRVVTLKGVLAP